MFRGVTFGDRSIGSSGDTHPDWCMGGVLLPPYLIAGASAIGQIHLTDKDPHRDDAFMVRNAGPWLALAVSDGVGSRPLSRFGACYVVESLTSQLLKPFVSINALIQKERARGSMGEPAFSAVAEDAEFKGRVILKAGKPLELAEYLAAVQKAEAQQIHTLLQPDEAFTSFSSNSWVWSRSIQRSIMNQERDSTDDLEMITQSQDIEQVMFRAFEKTHAGVQIFARENLHVDASELSCTALAILLNIQTGTFVVGHVGDGAILGLTMRDEVMELSRPDDTGDQQSAYVITRPNYIKHLDVRIYPHQEEPFQALYLMTDGVSGDLLYSKEMFERLPGWANLVRQNLLVSPSPTQAAGGMLDYLASYKVKGSGDDRTMVVIARMENTHA